MITQGEFYTELTNKRKDSKELKACMEEAVEKLLGSETNMHKPGMLLGKIQSVEKYSHIWA